MVLDQQNPEARNFACATLILARNLVAQVYIICLVFSFIFRSLIIFYADRGLVTQGEPNLGLLRKLFWLVVVAFLFVGHTIFPLNAIVLGTFPRDGIEGRICLLRGTFPDQEEKVEGVRERRLVAVSFYCLDLFVLVYFSSRVNKFLRGLCPNGRMSCIGNYKRNVLDFAQTFYLVLVGVVFSIFKIVTILVIEDNSFHLPKKTTFWIWNVVEMVCNEGFYFFTIPFLIVVRPSYQAGVSILRETPNCRTLET